jgi:signal peptidase I
MPKHFYVIVTICLMVLGLIVASFVLPFFHGLHMLMVQSSSMSPTLPLGSLIVVLPATQYAVGDIVTFWHGQEFITHRIVGERNDDGQARFVTRGDASYSPDQQLLAPAELLGRVRLVLPYAGFGAAVVQTRLGLLLILAVFISDFFGRILKLCTFPQSSSNSVTHLVRSKFTWRP